MGKFIFCNVTGKRIYHGDTVLSLKERGKTEYFHQSALKKEEAHWFYWKIEKNKDRVKEVVLILKDDLKKTELNGKIYSDDMLRKENILKLPLADLKIFKQEVKKFVFSDKDFRIAAYKRGAIYNNTFFYDNVGVSFKFTKEELKDILTSKQFDSKSFVMGSEQTQRENAINHLIKTQDIDSEIVQMIFNKYQDDSAMICKTMKYMLKKNKLDGLGKESKNKVAETILWSEDFKKIAKIFKERVDIEELDEELKLLYFIKGEL